MRCLTLKFVGYAAVGALSVVSLSANVLFAVSVATEAHDKAVYGVASASIDVLKFVAVILVVRLWHKHHHVLAILSAVLGVMCVTWSLASAVGYATSTRADMVASRSAIATAREGWVTTVERAQHSLDGLGRHRPIGAIEAELVAAQAAAWAIWERTSGCSNVTRPDSLSMCQPFLLLRRELAAAQEVTRLERTIENGRSQILAQPVTGHNADPQVVALATVVGLDEPTMRHGLALMLALLIEIASATGFAIVAGATAKSPGPSNPTPALQTRHRRPSATRQAKLATNVVRLVTSPLSRRPANTRHTAAMETWISAHVSPSPGTETAARGAYNSYRARAHQAGIVPATETAFGRELTSRLAALGGRKCKRRSGTFYLDVAVGEAPAVIVNKAAA